MKNFKYCFAFEFLLLLRQFCQKFVFLSLLYNVKMFPCKDPTRPPRARRLPLPPRRLPPPPRLPPPCLHQRQQSQAVVCSVRVGLQVGAHCNKPGTTLATLPLLLATLGQLKRLAVQSTEDGAARRGAAAALRQPP